jgi:nicotinamidase-related amidase
VPKPPKRALVVIDVQNEYISGNLRIERPDPRRSLDRIGRAMDVAAAYGISVVVVQNSAPATAPIFAKGSPGWQLHESIARRPRSHYVEKTLPSAFAGTDLAHWIDREGIDTLTLAGYMTHNCVAATAFHALHAGLAVEVLSDATGSVPYANAAGRAEAENIHHVFSVVFQSRFAAVLDTGTWLAALASGETPHRDNIYASNQNAIRPGARGQCERLAREPLD